MLVSQHEPRIEVYRRNADATWTLEHERPGADAKIADALNDNARRGAAGAG